MRLVAKFRIYTAFNKKKILFASKRDLNLRKSETTFAAFVLYFADTRTLRENGSEMPCNSSYVVQEKISRTDGAKNVEVLYEVKDEVDILHTIKLRKDIWIDHTLRWSSLLNRLIEVGEDEDKDLSSCWMTLR